MKPSQRWFLAFSPLATMPTLLAQSMQRVREEFRPSKTPAKCPVSSSAAVRLLKMCSPPQLRRGCWAEAQRGWLAIKQEDCGSEPVTASNHPENSRRPLSAPPFPRRGAARFSSLEVPPRMRGSSENLIPVEVGSERRQSASAHAPSGGTRPPTVLVTPREASEEASLHAVIPTDFELLERSAPKRAFNRVHALRCYAGAWLALLLLFMCRATLGQTKD